jgi:CubicO group peptidase (beta-lactamase class C family)
MPKFRIILTVAFILLTGIYQSVFADSKLTPPDSLSKDITELFTKYKIPGASIAVIHDEKIIWTQVLGDRDTSTHQPIETNTLFQACSITKTLTSVAVMQVLSKYNISLDAPVNHYLKRWKIPENRFTKGHPITIRMLLNHTAAISNPYPDGGYAYNAKLPTLTQVFLGQAPATNPPLQVTNTPGKKYSYCNGCYSILQMFLEDVTSESYPKFMQENILQPLKMTNSYFDNRLFIESPDKVALPYDANRIRFAKAPITNPIYSTGLLWTTPTDLAKFIIAMQKSLNTDQGFLPRKIALLLTSPSSTPTRGLGFFISNKVDKEQKNGHYFMHTGNNIGYLTLLIGSRDGKNGAAIMINISPEWNANDFPQFGFINDSLKLIADYYHWQ